MEFYYLKPLGYDRAKADSALLRTWQCEQKQEYITFTRSNKFHTNYFYQKSILLYYPKIILIDRIINDLTILTFLDLNI